MAIIHKIELTGDNYEESPCILRISTSSTPGVLGIEVEEVVFPVSSYTNFEVTTDQLRGLIPDLEDLINISEQGLL